LLRFRVDHARSEKEIGKTVVIEIRDGRSPADKAVLDTKTRAQSFIAKVAFSVVVVEDLSIAPEMRFEDVEESIAIEVCSRPSSLSETPRSSPCSVKVPS
jgi:hypothetical protein